MIRFTMLVPVDCPTCGQTNDVAGVGGALEQPMIVRCIKP